MLRKKSYPVLAEFYAGVLTETYYKSSPVIFHLLIFGSLKLKITLSLSAEVLELETTV